MSTALLDDAPPAATAPADPQPGGSAVQPDPIPLRVTDLGLPLPLLQALLAKHLQAGGEQSLMSIAGRMAVHPSVAGELVTSLLDGGLVHADAGAIGQLRVGLNARGHSYAQAAQEHDPYVGPTPLSAAHYSRLVEANSLLTHPVTRAQLHRAFADVVVADETLDQLGHALNSARPLLVHGPSGTGKTYLCERLTKVVDGTTLIPYAIAVEDRCVAVYDPALHDAVDDPLTLPADGSSDPRLLCCRRPALLTGGELHRGALDIDIDPHSGIAQAPLTLRANGGVLVIDDFGCQRIPADELMRRLALPIETHRDWIRLDSTYSTEVPFDVRLILITNLELERLAGDMFRHLVGHRIPLGEISAANYLKLWQHACQAFGIPFDPALPQYALEALHGPRGVAPLAAHPSGLLACLHEQARYSGTGATPTRAMLERAWTEYLSTSAGEATAPRPPYRTH
ncbi:MAG: hypothetical protein WC809_15775 [Sinimarinibacterium sp.]